MDQGPIHLVNAGLVDQLKDLGWQVQFDGHHQFEEVSAERDPPIGVLKNPRLVSNVSKAVAESVGAHARKGFISGYKNIHNQAFYNTLQMRKIWYMARRKKNSFRKFDKKPYYERKNYRYHK